VGKKTKVVLDTNIWFSIFFNRVLGVEFGGLFSGKKIEVFVSEEILKEIARVLEYPKIKSILEKAGVSSRDVLEEIVAKSKLVNPKSKLNVVKDSEDNKFLECALECEADYIVSGDKHLLEIKEFGGIKIVSAREFLKSCR